MDKRILVIDDDHLVVKTIGKLLKMEGYFVITSESGKEALSIIEKEEIDLIISDIRMPGIDGLNVCKKLKTDVMTQHIKIIILSGHLDKDNIDLAFNYGADKIFSKPILYDVIEEEIEILLSE